MAEVCRVLGGQGEKCHLEISIDTLLRETLVGLLSLSLSLWGREGGFLETCLAALCCQN